MGRKNPVKRFSGPTTTDVEALDRALASAVAVRVSPDGYLVYAVDPTSDVLAADTEKYVSIVSTAVLASSDAPDDVAELRQALMVSELSSDVCMCSGELALEFLDATGSPVEVVRFDSPDTIEWARWDGRARLTEPQRLITWLEAQGVTVRSA